MKIIETNASDKIPAHPSAFVKNGDATPGLLQVPVKNSIFSFLLFFRLILNKPSAPLAVIAIYREGPKSLTIDELSIAQLHYPLKVYVSIWHLSRGL
jgi:hypothetical protein